MEVQKIRDLLKDHNHLLIDYSDKFINIDDKDDIDIAKLSQRYFNIYNKLKDDKYSNVVFLLNISKLFKYNHKFYILFLKDIEIPSYTTNIYLLKNSFNSCWIVSGEFETNINKITDFINQKYVLIACNVCFGEKESWRPYEICYICNYRTCKDCIIKSGNLNKKCFGCRNDTNARYDVLYNRI
jgi:hypothetical protein